MRAPVPGAGAGVLPGAAVVAGEAEEVVEEDRNYFKIKFTYLNQNLKNATQI
jgi:hypothetical protein